MCSERYWWPGAAGGCRRSRGRERRSDAQPLEPARQLLQGVVHLNHAPVRSEPRPREEGRPCHSPVGSTFHQVAARRHSAGIAIGPTVQPEGRVRFQSSAFATRCSSHHR